MYRFIYLGLALTLFIVSIIQTRRFLNKREDGVNWTAQRSVHFTIVLVASCFIGKGIDPNGLANLVSIEVVTFLSDLITTLLYCMLIHVAICLMRTEVTTLNHLERVALLITVIFFGISVACAVMQFIVTAVQTVRIVQQTIFSVMMMLLLLGIWSTYCMVSNNYRNLGEGRRRKLKVLVGTVTGMGMLCLGVQVCLLYKLSLMLKVHDENNGQDCDMKMAWLGGLDYIQPSCTSTVEFGQFIISGWQGLQSCA